MHVTDVRYVASQPWPFPQSLMLGFTARLEGDATLRLDPTEIEEARWFTRDGAPLAARGRGRCRRRCRSRGTSSTAGSPARSKRSAPAAPARGGRGSRPAPPRRPARRGRPRRRSGRTPAAATPPRPASAGAGRPGATRRWTTTSKASPSPCSSDPATRTHPARRQRPARQPGRPVASECPTAPAGTRRCHRGPAGRAPRAPARRCPASRCSGRRGRCGRAPAAARPAGRSPAPGRRRRAGPGRGAGRRAAVASAAGSATSGPSTATRSAVAPGSGGSAASSASEPVGQRVGADRFGAGQERPSPATTAPDRVRVRRPSAARGAGGSADGRPAGHRAPSVVSGTAGRSSSGVEDRAGELVHGPAGAAGLAAQQLERRPRRGAVPLGEDADRPLGGDPGGQGVLQLRDGPLQGGQPGVAGIQLGIGAGGGRRGRHGGRSGPARAPCRRPRPAGRRATGPRAGHRRPSAAPGATTDHPRAVRTTITVEAAAGPVVCGQPGARPACSTRLLTDTTSVGDPGTGTRAAARCGPLGSR